ncbi:uncharacterized protein CLAFUR5_04851 [Fulvia fulva]|uniref:Heterokaryon incompatibility domain-containing protein n=1 Tax=Passalora fulva TaxID=5499 RepID=A0A9Q8LF14_PASFU|nr:uncharacterized protein CLAFUR5_04851 [Fulvia fulva]UJO16226.1 hypothetical protein CLAFUR5_04851 [Fulvia fulva]
MASQGGDRSDAVGSEPPYIRLSQGYNIRLVELLPGKPNAALETRLRVHDLEQAPSYDALSYVWGTQKDKKAIVCSGKTLQITRNLEAALRRMRHLDRSKLLWTDAICMCQDDVVEKTHHVGFMDKVYRRADRVLVHMPASSDARPRDVASLVNEHDVRLASRRLQDMPAIADDEGLLDDERWSSLAGLLLRRYGISYTSTHTDWEDWTPDWKANSDYDYSAIDLLSHAKGLGCTDARDRIYAFLGHPLLRSADDNAPIILPNYAKDYTEHRLYTDFTVSLLSSATGIKALSAVEHDEKTILDDDSPSRAIHWTMDIIWNSMGYYSLFSYRVSGIAELLGRLHVDTPSGTLLLEGVFVYTVDRVYQFSEEEEKWPIAGAANALASNHDLSSLLSRIAGAVLAARVEQLVYDRDACWDAMNMSLCTGLTNYECAEDDLQQHRANVAAFWHLLLEVDRAHDFELASLQDMNAPAHPEGSADRFYDDILLACKGRSFFITKQGDLGLGPWIAKPGDQCFVLRSARVPFVLRTVREGCWKLVGECYVHGIMNGGFVDGSDVQWQNLSIN